VPPQRLIDATVFVGHVLPPQQRAHTCQVQRRAVGHGDMVIRSAAEHVGRVCRRRALLQDQNRDVHRPRSVPNLVQCADSARQIGHHDHGAVDVAAAQHGGRHAW
jgi:hypothetical protein